MCRGLGSGLDLRSPRNDNDRLRHLPGTHHPRLRRAERGSDPPWCAVRRGGSLSRSALRVCFSAVFPESAVALIRDPWCALFVRVRLNGSARSVDPGCRLRRSRGDEPDGAPLIPAPSARAKPILPAGAGCWIRHLIPAGTVVCCR